MVVSRRTLSETSRVKIVLRRFSDNKERRLYQLINKRTGFYTEWETNEIFDLTELLDDLCDFLENQENNQ